MSKSIEYPHLPSPQVLGNPTSEDFDDFHLLVSQLSSKKRTLEAVTANIVRAVASPDTTVFVMRDPEQQRRIKGTATVNIGRTHRGPDGWIDDVVTDESVRGKGFSKPLMNVGEATVHAVDNKVRLTSSATRETARNGYAKRGYHLIRDSLWRNENPQKEPVPGVEMLTELQDRDVEMIAGLLGQDPGITQGDLETAQESSISNLFVVRGDGDTIRGIASSVVCPIPVGYKAWVHVDAPDSVDTAALIAAAEYALPPEATAMNTTSAPPAEAEGYTLRDSGLYVLGRVAIA